MLKLTGKFMQDKLKLGWTTSDFANYFNTSEEYFLDSLKKTFSDKSCKSIHIRLKKNLKLKQRLGRSSSTCIKNSNITNNIIQDEDTTLSDNSVTTEPELSEETETDNFLEELKEKEAELNDYICHKESAYYSLIHQKRDLSKQLQAKKEMIIRIKNIIKRHQESIISLYDQLVFVSSNVNMTFDEISKTYEQLLDIQEQIRLIEKVTIFVYDDGELESDNENINLEINDNDLTSFLTTVYANPILENLTLKQIKQLAKLYLITKKLDENGFAYELTFEEENFKDIFEKITN